MLGIAIGGLAAVLRAEPPGMELAAEALRHHGVEPARIAAWVVDQQAQAGRVDPGGHAELQGVRDTEPTSDASSDVRQI